MKSHKVVPLGGRCFNHPRNPVNVWNIQVATEYKGGVMRDRQRVDCDSNRSFSSLEGGD